MQVLKQAANDDRALGDGLLERAPRPLLAFLAGYVLILLGYLAITRELQHAVQAGVVVVAAWLALQGSPGAAYFLGVLFAFGALAGARDTAALLRLDALEAAISAFYTGLLAAGAVYVFASRAMRHLRARAQRLRWRTR